MIYFWKKKEEDVIVYEFYLAERSHKTDKAIALLEILKNKVGSDG